MQGQAKNLHGGLLELVDSQLSASETPFLSQAPVSYLSEPGQETITKSVSILNEGVGTAGLAVSSGEAITINAGASDSVHLRGLTIEGSGTGNKTVLCSTRVEISKSKTASSGILGLITGSSSCPALRAASRCRIRLFPITSMGFLSGPSDRRSSPARSAKSRRTIIAMESQWMTGSRPGHRSMSPSAIERHPKTTFF